MLDPTLAASFRSCTTEGYPTCPGRTHLPERKTSPPSCVCPSRDGGVSWIVIRVVRDRRREEIGVGGTETARRCSFEGATRDGRGHRDRLSSIEVRLPLPI